ncbi:hypothetical protein COCVIDRAFT_23857 [Bipolaris victoriae FI3]|uniref:CorA-like transporter domain-containing protein n=1 Tax=Bipolaris victoriae (strain FI3) TaxID=930091 RepID=W7ET47_BIPV3|nr:hypothetical protein COCVIDRAFT_23857 [Bipolaris victoriae FI3]
MRLDAAEFDLCLGPSDGDIDEIFEIPMIDLGAHRRYIHSSTKLTEWLGITLAPDTCGPSRQHSTVQKRDPKCRFIYLYGESSRDKLKITRQSLCEILSYHGVMPVYLDFMLVFGGQTDARDLRFSGFREQICLRNSTTGHAAPELGRSGSLFQLCYNLKGVQSRKTSDENIRLHVWTIRDAAIYHQFDVKYGTTLWIVTKGGRDILDRFLELSGRPEDSMYHDYIACFRSTLVTHLLYCHWSTEDWRWYIVWLERMIDLESGMAVYGLRIPGCAYREYEPWDIQDLQHWQDRTNAAVMVLQSNAKIVRVLHGFYTRLISREDFPSDLHMACKDDLHAFFSQLDEILGDFDMQITRAKLLATTINDRKELVVQHLHSQASERTEQLNKNLEREAIVMRIITSVTLLYLPATFVSTFFSTDVIKYQDQNQDSANYKNGSFSSLALKRWLQVTIPLTFVTLLGAWSTYRSYNTTVERFPFSERLKRLVPGLAASPTDSRSTRGMAQGDSHPNSGSDAIRKEPLLVQPRSPTHQSEIACFSYVS